MLTIYQIDAFGYWNGATREIGERDGSPRGWTRTPVPALAEGEYAVWRGNGWGVTLKPPGPPAPSIAQRKDAMLADLAARRYAVEVAGIVYARASDSKAYGISTDRDSQPKLAAERAAATDGLRAADDVWKCLDTATGRYVFIPFTDAEVIAFANAARAHVSAAFKREGELAAQIEAAEDDAALDAIDIETGWPGQ